MQNWLRSRGRRFTIGVKAIIAIAIVASMISLMAAPKHKARKDTPKSLATDPVGLYVTFYGVTEELDQKWYVPLDTDPDVGPDFYYVDNGVCQIYVEKYVVADEDFWDIIVASDDEPDHYAEWYSPRSSVYGWYYATDCGMNTSGDADVTAD